MATRMALVAPALAMATTLAAPLVSAQSCDDAAMFPNRVVISGSTAIRPLVRRVGAILARATGAERVTLIYNTSRGSCSGVAALASASSTTPQTATGTAEVYNGLDPAMLPSTIPTCTMPSAGLPVDLALSDVYATECAGVDTARLRDTLAVVLPFEFIGPALNSDESGIDAREAYQIYGFGASTAGVSPWTVDANVFQRSATSGTQITIARSIRVPEGRFQTPTANSLSGTSDMISRVAAAMTTPALGFAGTDATNGARGTQLRALAYRHWGQTNFYYPDATAASFDKRNVRDGHYPVWGYEHALVMNSAAGTPVNAAAARVADMLAGTVTLPGGDDIQRVYARSYLVPICAMEVARTRDGGDFSLATQSAPCTRLFECSYPGSTTTCTTCTDSSACAGGVCRRGVCEAR